MKKLIFDHDLGSDCDDAGAGAIVAKAVKAGDCKVLAVTHAISDPYGQYAMEAIFEYLGVTGIPFGYNLENQKLGTEDYHQCAKYAVEKYFGNRPLPERKSNIKLLRKVLAENNQKDITLLTTGPSVTLFELYRTQGDEISPKSGRELVADNICEFIYTGGNFVSSEVMDWNNRADPESSFAVLNDSPIPITYCGNEIGGCIFTGQILPDQPEDYPLRDCYYLLTNFEDCVRNSWDLVAAYIAIYGPGKYWRVNRGYDVHVNADGQTFYQKGGPHNFISYNVNLEEYIDEIQDMLNDFIAVTK